MTSKKTQRRNTRTNAQKKDIRRKLNEKAERERAAERERMIAKLGGSIDG